MGAPQVVVEDGSIVANANSFVTRDDVQSYCDNRGYTFSVSDTAKADKAVIAAGDWLKNTQRLVYRGSLREATQTMPWPRASATFYRGPAIASNVVPQCVKDAQCEIAYRIYGGTNVQPDLSHGGRVKSIKAGEVEEEFFPDASPEKVIQAAVGILWSVLLNGRVLITTPYQATPADVSPFLPGQFDNPPSSYTTGSTPSTSGLPSTT